MTQSPITSLSARCATCKYWQHENEPYSKAIDAKRCKYAVHIPDAQEWDENYNNVLKNEFSGTKAFVNDASGYSACFYTKADFGCNQHEDREDV